MSKIMVGLFMLMAFLIGNKIGHEAAKAKHRGAQQDADARYGCTLRQQAPNGECE